MTALDQLGILRAALAVPVWSRTAPQHVLLQEITREAEQDALERVERFRGRVGTRPRPRPLPAGVRLRRLVADPASDLPRIP